MLAEQSSWLLPLALARIGVVAGCQTYREASVSRAGQPHPLGHMLRPGWAGRWVLPLLLLRYAVVQAAMLLPFPAWSVWLTPLVLTLSGLAALVLLIRRGDAADTRVSLMAAGVGCLALLIAPAVWSGISIWNNNGAAWLPEAGPSGGGRGPLGLAFGAAARPRGPGSGPGGNRVGLGGPGGQAAPGGPFFAGGGQPDGSQQLVSSSQDATADLLVWVRASCVAAPAEDWQTGNQDAGGHTLYDCGSLAREVRTRE